MNPTTTGPVTEVLWRASLALRYADACAGHLERRSSYDRMAVLDRPALAREAAAHLDRVAALVDNARVRLADGRGGHTTAPGHVGEVA